VLPRGVSPWKSSLAPARPWRTSPIWRVRLRIPRCSNDHRSYKGRLPLPRPRSESMHRNQKARRPPARSARPRGPTLPHRIYRQNQHETVTPCNPKNHSHLAPPPRAITATRKFPRSAVNAIPTSAAARCSHGRRGYSARHTKLCILQLWTVPNLSSFWAVPWKTYAASRWRPGATPIPNGTAPVGPGTTWPGAGRLEAHEYGRPGRQRDSR
jgi:hypothetical protein